MDLKPFLILGISTLSAYSQAAVISFDPTNQTASLGATTSVDLLISDLGDEIVSAFELSVTYDSNILDFQNFSFGSGLDPFNLGTFNSVTEAGNTLNIFELSFDLDEELAMFQPNAFVLGTFSFDAIAAGTSNLNITFVDVVGALEFDPQLGFNIPSTVQTSAQDGFVEVVRPTGTIPVPTSLALLLAGLLGVGFTRKLN